MAWPPGYPGFPAAPVQPGFPNPYGPPQPVYNQPPVGGWPPGAYQPPNSYSPTNSMPPPTGGAWPPGHPMATQPSNPPTSTGGWTPTSSPYNTGTPGYPPTGYSSSYTSSGSSGGYNTGTGGSSSSYNPSYNTGGAWPPSQSYNSNPSANVAPYPGYVPSNTNPPLARSNTQPLNPIATQPNSGYPPQYYPPQNSNPYSSNPASAPNSYLTPTGNPFANPYAPPPSNNPYGNTNQPSSYQAPTGAYPPPSTGSTTASLSANTPVGPYGAPLAATQATQAYSPQTGRAGSVSGISPVQQILLKEQQEEMARQEARKKAESEAAVKKAALEALQRRETAEAQRATFLHQMEMDRIEKEAKDARDALERQQKMALSAEEQRRKDALARAQKEAEEIEAKNRAAMRLRAQQEEAKLKAEQERLDKRQAELAAKERQLASAAERERQDAQEAAKAREAEMAKQAEETEKMQQTFYSSIIDVTKILATTNQRINKLITLSYDDMSRAMSNKTGNLVDLSPEAQFLAELLGHLDKTTNRLVSMIQDNVMNVDDTVHSSIATSVSNLSNGASALLSFCRRLVTQPMDAELAAMAPEERQSNAKKRATAVTYAIKNVIESLEKMKIEEGASNDTKVLSAQSTEEAQQNVEAQLKAQAGERSRIAVQLGLSSKRPLLLSTQFDPSSIDLKSYDLKKVNVLQRCIHHWAMRLHFSRLVELLTQSNQDNATNAHRKKVLFEVLSTEASYFQTLDTIIEYFYKPLHGAAHKPNNGIITKEEVAKLFSSIEDIHKFSKKLLAEFDSRLQKWPTVQFFGDIFLEHADEFMVYSDYINGFDEATLALKKLLLNPKFVAFEQECMKATGKRLDLASLLIQPVQRMPRYGLLLKELISHSSKDHIDYTNLVDAKSKVQEVCSDINKKKLEYDNKIAVQRITSEILNLPSPINASSSIFIVSDYIYLEGDIKHWSKAYLFSDLVVFAKAKSEKATPPYHFWEAFPLVGVGVVGRKGHKKSFLMWDKTGNKKLERILHFSDELTNNRWLKEMKECCETASLQAMLSDDVAITVPQAKTGTLTLLCASYGDLSNPDATIDVTSILQKIISDQGGKGLTLSAQPKSTIPGFIDPAKSKKKTILIVYTYGGPPKTRTFMDESPILITS